MEASVSMLFYFCKKLQTQDWMVEWPVNIRPIEQLVVFDIRGKTHNKYRIYTVMSVFVMVSTNGVKIHNE